MAQEIAPGIEASIVMTQQSFIGTWEKYYSRLNFHWLQKKRKDIRIMTVIKKDFLHRMMMENSIDLINHLYFILDRVVNLTYDLQLLVKEGELSIGIPLG